MTPAGRARLGCDAAGARWRAADPPLSLSKRIGGVPQHWPPLPHPHLAAAGPRTRGPPHAPLPPLPLFHTRHAEHSAERPRLVTVVKPCGQSALRKVTVLLNRRGVVSYEQLLLDVSEALGFPRWHRARVTRLYTTHAQEVKGVCDFFCGEVAFLALGKARPDLGSVEEALEELFPEHSAYRADALRAWEKRLRPAPDKAVKADSGYSEGTDSTRAQRSHKHNHTHLDANTHTRSHRATQGLTHAPQHTDSHNNRHAKHNLDTQKRSHHRYPVHTPNHLQRVWVRGGARETQPSVIGPFTQEEEELREETDIPFPALCRNCKWRHQNFNQINQVAGRVPLPPLTRKKGNTPKEQEVRDVSATPPRPISRAEEKCISQLEHESSNRHQGEESKEEVQKPIVTFDLPSDGSDVSLSDIEHRYDIGRVMGDGNFAVVHECRRRDTGETLAMKIVEHSKLIGREHMMQNELSLLGSLHHPRVVRLFTHHRTHTHSYLVMEMVSGGDLFEAIADRGKFPEDKAGMMVSDVSEALRYIHSKSIVHRDLKPENLLVESQGNGSSRLKLADFGLAMVVTEPIFTVCGTPTYVAPEILSETGYGLAVDVWALGVILYILLCGFPPFRSHDRDQEELFQLIKQGALHFLSPYWDSISEVAQGLVRALLQVDPTKRLTAAQTLQHPWVLNAGKASSQQGALTHIPQTSTDQLQILQTSGDQPKLQQRGTDQLKPQQISTDQRKLPQTSTDQLKLPQTSTDQLKLPQTSTDQLKLPQTSTDQLKLPQTSTDQLKLPQTSTDQLKLPQTSTELPRTKETNRDQSRLTETNRDQYQHHQRSSGTLVRPISPSPAPPQHNPNTDQQRPLNPTQMEYNPHNQPLPTNIPTQQYPPQTLSYTLQSANTLAPHLLMQWTEPPIHSQTLQQQPSPTESPSHNPPQQRSPPALAPPPSP